MNRWLSHYNYLKLILLVFNNTFCNRIDQPIDCYEIHPIGKVFQRNLFSQSHIFQIKTGDYFTSNVHNASVFQFEIIDILDVQCASNGVWI